MFEHHIDLCPVASLEFLAQLELTLHCAENGAHPVFEARLIFDSRIGRKSTQLLGDLFGVDDDVLDSTLVAELGGFEANENLLKLLQPTSIVELLCSSRMCGCGGNG